MRNAGYTLAVAAGLFSTGCGSVRPWNGRGWIDQLDGAVAAIVVDRGIVFVPRARLPADAREGDFIENGTVDAAKRREVLSDLHERIERLSGSRDGP